MLISQNIQVCNAFACGGNTTYYSNSFELSHGFVFGIWYKAASSGTVALQIQLEESYYKLAKTEEGASHSLWAVPATNTDIDAALASTALAMKSVSPVFMPYARLKIIGGGANDASTTLTAIFIVQEFTGKI